MPLENTEISQLSNAEMFPKGIQNGDAHRIPDFSLALKDMD
jgi:hypothetical protein